MTVEGCEICKFLIKGKTSAKSKQAISEYSVAFVDHYMKIHLNEDAK